MMIRRAIADTVSNAALIELERIVTVTETLRAVSAAREADYGTVISHRSVEPANDFIANLAVATAARQLETGAPARREHIPKYNQPPGIEQDLGADARSTGGRFLVEKAFRRG